jgi:hypothetical protein
MRDKQLSKNDTPVANCAAGDVFEIFGKLHATKVSQKQRPLAHFYAQRP